MVAQKKLGFNQDTSYNPKNKRSKEEATDKYETSSLPINENSSTPNCSYLHVDPLKSRIQRASDLLVAVSAGAEVHKAKIRNIAFSAIEELVIMAREQEPLWFLDVEKGCEVLNEEIYKQRFVSLDPTLDEIIKVIVSGAPSSDRIVNFKINDNYRLNSEASRAIGFVFQDPISLVHMFMDVEKWSEFFCNIVSNAMSLGVLSSENHLNGLLKLMVAEFQVPSPLVKTRETYFVRCSRQIDSVTWAVVDVSLENVFPNPAGGTCRRKPSGCIIQALQDGLSMVTWVEHNAVCNGTVHYMFRELLSSGLGFSAKRWISSLERQADRIATQEAQNELSINNGLGLAASRNGLLKLAERMVRRFSSNTRTDSESTWMPLPISGAEEILVKTSSNLDDPGFPRGIVVTIATSVWLPLQQVDTFNFLRNEHNRSKWDILSPGLEIRDIVRVSSARNSSDSVSVVSAQLPIGRTVVTYLQESFSDSTASCIVYSPVDVPTMQHILQGGNVDSVTILPSGFAVLPDGLNSVLTIAFEVMDEEQETQEFYLPPQSVLTVYRMMKETVSRIEAALLLL